MTASIFTLTGASFPKTSRPLTAFKNTLNPKVIQNLSWRSIFTLTGTSFPKTSQPLTAFKMPWAPKLSRISPGDCFWGFQSGGLEFVKKLSSKNYICPKTIVGLILVQIPVPLTGTLKNDRQDTFWTNLGFGAFLNAVRGRRVHKTSFQNSRLRPNLRPRNRARISVSPSSTAKLTFSRCGWVTPSRRRKFPVLGQNFTEIAGNSKNGSKMGQKQVKSGFWGWRKIGQKIQDITDFRPIWDAFYPTPPRPTHLTNLFKNVFGVSAASGHLLLLQFWAKCAWSLQLQSWGRRQTVVSKDFVTIEWGVFGRGLLAIVDLSSNPTS